MKTFNILEIPVGSKLDPIPTKLLIQSELLVSLIQLYPAVYNDKKVSKLNNYPKFNDEVAYYSNFPSSFNAKTDVIVIPDPKNASVSFAKTPVVIPFAADALKVATYVKIPLMSAPFNLFNYSGISAFFVAVF